MDDLRDELHEAITKAEQAFADDVTAAMAKRAAAVTEAIAANRKAYDLRMAAFNGVTPLKEPVIRDVASGVTQAIENELDPLPSVVRNRANGVLPERLRGQS